MITQCSLFNNMNEEEIDLILGGINYVTKQFLKNEIIVEESCNMNKIGILLKGKASVNRNFCDGKLVTLHYLSVGDVFGVSNIFCCNLPFPSTIRALSKCSILFIEKENLLKIIKGNDKFTENYLCYCNNKILFLNDKILLFNIQGTLKRLCYFLLKESYSHNNSLNIKLPFSKEALSSYLGISRASLYRELKRLQEKKLIKINNRQIEILDIQSITLL